MSTFDRICLGIRTNSDEWREGLEEYRHLASGEELFAIAQELLDTFDANGDRLLAIELLTESMELLKEVSTELRVPIVELLIRQLAVGKQPERATAALYIAWLDGVARATRDKARGAAQRAIDQLRHEFEFLRAE